ncbi:MAG: sugar phosphate isomerase/epimerase [Methanobacteriaceae archaeon]|jgi:sugar phosphate isomerase/epimerase|nr:sugar phosphate isomerase/epimerase [Candidatus Methanorudis spinitermitis]
MKIGVSSLSFYKENILNNLEFIEGLNVDYFEILKDYPNDKIDNDILKSYNLKYTVHSPFIDLNLSSLNRNIQKLSIAEIKKSIDLARELESEIVVVHPGSVPFLSRPFEKEILAISKESIKICGDYGKDLGVKVAIENMPNIEGFLYQNVFKLNELLEELEMTMTLDLAHAITNGFKENELYFDSVKHIHLSDNNHEFDEHLSLGEGSIDFKAVIDIFNKNNYDGVYTIEVYDKESVVKSVEYLKKI